MMDFLDGDGWTEWKEEWKIWNVSLLQQLLRDFKNVWFDISKKKNIRIKN